MKRSDPLDVDVAELSALIDGELDATRKAEVEHAIEVNAALRTEFEKLRVADLVWAGSATDAVTRTTIRWDTMAVADFGIVGAKLTLVAFVLIVLRAVPKLSDGAILGVLLHSIALSCFLVWLIRMLNADRSKTTTSGSAAA
jgi:anti-sigma factor RsiW